MRASLSIIARADLCGDLLPEGEDGEILEASAGEAWEWLQSRTTLANPSEVLVELPTAALLTAWRSGNVDSLEDVERRFMEGWQPPQPIWFALEEMIGAGVGQVLVYRDCD
ncbi:MAG: hypothetical protein H6945_00145 [Zoogloeaceae bacterium]|nr:hypothetical protein [Zoogloeaceae bacterium]